MAGVPAAARALLGTPAAPPPPPAPVRGSLVAAVAELSRVTACAERLQNELSPILRRGGEAAEAAQTLDEITQHLHGLEGFLAAIAHDCPPDWRLDLSEAAGRLRLHSQKLRLTCADAAPIAAHPPRPPVSGDLELW